MEACLVWKSLAWTSLRRQLYKIGQIEDFRLKR
jgi:hypothetical protein